MATDTCCIRIDTQTRTSAIELAELIGARMGVRITQGTAVRMAVDMALQKEREKEVRKKKNEA